METRSIATPAQVQLGIEAFILEIPDAVGRITEYQGWTKTPTMAAGQFVGFCFVSDGDEALSLLEARVVVQAADIEAELTPAPVTPAPTKKTKAPKRSRYDYPDRGDILAGFRVDVQHTNGLMRDLEQAA